MTICFYEAIVPPRLQFFAPRLSLLPSIKFKYLRGVIKVPLPFEEFWYVFGINSSHDAVAYVHIEPRSFAGELSVQYNTLLQP